MIALELDYAGTATGARIAQPFLPSPVGDGSILLGQNHEYAFRNSLNRSVCLSCFFRRVLTP